MRERLEMPLSNRLTTAEEFLRMPEEPGVRMELVRGRVVRMNPVGVRHAEVMGRLYDLLKPHVTRTGVGRILLPAGFRLDSNPDTVREPDLAYVRRERLPANSEPEGYFSGPPDLAIEIMSPTDRLSPVRAKVAQYLETGVRMVWVVEPKRETVTVHQPSTAPLVLSKDDVLDGGDVIPGFRCNLRRIFK